MTKDEVIEELRRRAMEADIIKATAPVGEVYRAACVLVMEIEEEPGK